MLNAACWTLTVIAALAFMACIAWFRKNRYDVPRAVAVLVLAGLLMVSIDALARFADNAGADQSNSWWGNTLAPSPWAKAVAAHDGLGLTSRDLHVQINGDQLTARYTVTAGSASRLVRVVSADMDRDSGNDLVNNALGSLQVGEFRYGVTGSAYSLTPVSFGEPELSITGRTATVTVDSQSLRLYTGQQRIEVGKPAKVTVAGPDHVRLSPPGVRLLGLSGARELSTDKETVTLRRTRTTLTTTVRDGDAAAGWTGGLRAAGAITIPVADDFLQRIGSMFNFAVFLWAIVAARSMIPSSEALDRLRQLVRFALAGMGAVAFIGLALDITATIIAHVHTRDYVVAGPLGLMVAAIFVAWPAAAVRTARRPAAPSGSSSQDASGKNGKKGAWKSRTLGGMLAHLALGAVYLYVLSLLAARNGGTVNYWTVVPLTVLVAALTWLIARLVAGGRLAGWLVSGGMLALVLASTAGWQLLYGAWHWDYEGAPTRVNVLGKWMYVAAAVALVAGLAVIFGRSAWTVLKPYGRAWRRLGIAAVVIAIAVAVLPDTVLEAGVAAPHATGLQPASLLDMGNLFDSVLWLVDWLFVGLVLLLVMRLPSAPGTRQAARVLAIPIGLEALFWNQTWLYLPVEAGLGFLLLRFMILPKSLAELPAPQAPPQEALRRAITRWQAAEFTSGQRQALLTNSADKLRDLLLTPGKRRYGTAVNAMIAGQQELAAKQDGFRRDARAAKVGVFSRYGEPLSPASGKTGLITGAVLGIIPAVITVATTPPPGGNGSFPVLAFFGSTAWTLGQWALIGWFAGYFLPLIRGASGAEKAAWMFIATMAAPLPLNLIWSDGQDWISTLVSGLELLAFLLISTVIIDDLSALKAADMRLPDWVRVHNWRFAVTWSTAFIAAVGTAAVTFMSTTAADLSRDLVPPNQSQTSPTSLHR